MTRPIEFPGYTYEYEFDHTVKSTEFLTSSKLRSTANKVGAGFRLCALFLLLAANYLVRHRETLLVCASARMPQFSQGLGFDLADALAGDCEVLTNFLERVFGSGRPKPKRILITFSSRGVSVARTSSVISRRFEATTASAGFRIDLSSMKSPRCESSSSPIGVSSEIGSCAIFKTFRTFETGMSILLRNLFTRRFASQFLHQRSRSANQLVDRFDHVHRNANRARLIRDGARDRLSNPPRRVSRKLVAASPFKLVDRLHQTDVAFLNQIQELQTTIRVLLGNRNDQAKIGFDQFAFGLARLLLADDDRLKRTLDLDRTNTVVNLDLQPAVFWPLRCAACIPSGRQA